MTPHICEAMSLVAEYAEKQGWIPIGFKTFTVGDWTVTVNGTRQIRDELPAFTAKAENTRVVGVLIFDAFGGRAGGYLNIEDDFCEAMKRELEKVA